MNTYTTGTQRVAAIGMDDTGESVVAWLSDVPADPGQVRARRFASPLAIFLDGFESADACEWPGVVGDTAARGAC